MANAKQICKHSHLYLDVSPHAPKAGFKRPTERQRILAATKDGRVGKELDVITRKQLFGDGMTFPGPLILPDDDLAEDPEYPPQDFREWRDDEERNPVTRERKVIYIVTSPSIEQGVSKMETWSACRSHSSTRQHDTAVEPPDAQDIMEYLSAFFHGMDVKLFKKPYHWQKWDKYDGAILKNSNTERRIGLRTPTQELFGIRCRASPDGVSPMQVNLNDVLDALAENIPPDAHSIMILLDQDMYEGDGDIFCAGRAYGGSRIAAVSRFRDQPTCTPQDDGHGWPASHCAAYIDQLCLDGSKPTAKKAKLQPVQRKDDSGPLHSAIEAATIHPKSSIPAEALTVQWLGRLVVTMAHELCHCLGLDHCVYFACAMQGCCSVEEAQRQPPYVCPVCLEKIAATIGEGLVDGWDDEVKGKLIRERYMKERYEALRAFCEKRGDPSLSRMFAGYKAWLDAVIKPSL
ncbi:metalloprotease [Trichoderma arundinaceum]|uniref:Metalloprotease n=1 Tax=Trichoderma arundinaceum TaxID=490622 RepID=A0A395NYZ7_TRIAR|nr:metalloprotease [Trichoderma arundinaceum]